MPNHDDHFEQAAQYWRDGQALDAGRLIFEALPSDIRPRWASTILKIVLERSGIRSSVLQQVLDTAADRKFWGNGHRVFSMVRHETLKVDELDRTGHLTKDDELLGDVLSLAELVAKVTYNATNPPDEFDEDSGWWIAASLKGFVDKVWRDAEFSKAAWSALALTE
jgi:hypothetical protein